MFTPGHQTVLDNPLFPVSYFFVVFSLVPVWIIFYEVQMILQQIEQH